MGDHLTRRDPRGWWLPVVVALIVAIAAAGCGDDGDDDATSDASTDTQAEQDGASGTVTIEEAEAAAVEEVGEGTVTWSGPEDDRGAAWEIEVTRPDGSEVDVLVAADGSIVKTVEKYGEGPPIEGGGDVPSGGAVSLEEAEQAALDAIGEGTVTWSGPEDDRGAAWEIEITRPDGSEVDVLIAPDGSVVN